MENNRGINYLPLALIQEILLRLPVKSLLVSRCVCRMWLHLISNPNFAKSHFELAAEPTHRCLFIHGSNTLSYDLDSLFNDGYAPVKFSPPCESPSIVHVLASCRGFKYPNVIIWNPSTGAHKRISYSHIGVSGFHTIGIVLLLYGFGYDASRDDYLVVLAWRDKNKEDHFDFFSTRTNSWKSFGVALPNLLTHRVRIFALFLNGAFHWLPCPCHVDPILVFDLKEMSFSEIPLPEPVVWNWCCLMELGGCLSLYFWSHDECVAKIWVMKEYKVHSSWTLYAISDINFLPMALSSDGNIIGIDDEEDTGGFSKYNFSGDQLEHSSYHPFPYGRHVVYTESLLPLPKDS